MIYYIEHSVQVNYDYKYTDSSYIEYDTLGSYYITSIGYFS